MDKMARQSTEDRPVEVIHVKDAVGRQMTFPFDMANTWEGMQKLLEEAFKHVEVLEDEVKLGHYDLIGPNESIILPMVWGRLVQPGWQVSMAMWPPRPSQTPGPPPCAPPGATRTPMKGVPSPPAPARVSTPPRARPPPGASNLGAGAKRASTAKKPAERSKVAAALATALPARKKKPPPALFYSRVAGRARKPGYAGTAVRTGDSSNGDGGSDNSSDDSDGGNDNNSDNDSDGSSASSSSSSSSDSSAEREARQKAHESGLIIVVKRQPQYQKLGRNPTFELLEKHPQPVDRQDFSSALLYQEDVAEGITSIELTKASGQGKAQESANQMKWLSVTRTVMDYEEFENIALNSGDLGTNPDIRLAMESVFKAVRDKKLVKSANNWYIKAGTVMRCDVEANRETVGSVILTSVPYLQVAGLSRNFRVKFRKGICVPRRLHETFDPYDLSLERDRNQLFRKHEGAASDEVLWIGETWLLIVDSVGILTYGGKSRQDCLGDNIILRESPANRLEDRVVQVTTADGQGEFQIPIYRCETFFKLRSSIRHQLLTLQDGESDAAVSEFGLVFASGEAVTAKTWERVVKEVEHPVIPLAMEWVAEATSDSESVHSSAADGDAALGVGDQAGPDVEVRPGAKKAFLGMQKTLPVDPDESSDFHLPDLHPLVPPFLGWSILEAKRGRDSKGRPAEEADKEMRESVDMCLSRVETTLREKQLLQFGADSEIGFGVDEKLQAVLARPLTASRGSAHEYRFDDDEAFALYRELMQSSFTAMQAFAPSGVVSPVVTAFYSALWRGLEAPTTRTSPHPPRWVLYRQAKPLPGLKYINTPREPDGVKCAECSRQTIYDSVEAAVAHMRKRHGTAQPTAEFGPCPLEAMAGRRLRQEYGRVLRMARDAMARLVRRAHDIQEGVVVSGQFRQPALGVPYALLRSLETMVAFVCELPALLDGLHAFYGAGVFAAANHSLGLPAALREQSQQVRATGVAAERFMKNAEQDIVSAMRLGKSEDAVKFFTSVGPYCLASQMVGNLLALHVHNDASAGELYQAYAANYASQVYRRPSKRQIPQIGAMLDELERLRTVVKWQQRLVAALAVVLSPQTHRGPAKKLRKTRFRIEDYILARKADDLREEADLLSANLDKCEALISRVKQMTAILSDDQNRAIFVFTVVTIIFLPLSFIASYLSMNGGPSEAAEDWRPTQVLFWEISAPLTVAIGLFCLVVAWHGAEPDVVKRFMDRVARRWKRKDVDQASDSSSFEWRREEV